jgi:hypothetical protein
MPSRSRMTTVLSLRSSSLPKPGRRAGQIRHTLCDPFVCAMKGSDWSAQFEVLPEILEV